MKNLDKLENLMNELKLKYQNSEISENSKLEIKKIVSKR